MGTYVRVEKGARVARIAGGDVARRHALARVAALTPHEASWLAGLLEAEAHFYVTPNNGGANWQCGMSMALRDDDSDLVLELAHRTALGRVRPVRAQRTSLPQAAWQVDSRLETQRLASLLATFPPVGRRRHEVEEWISAVRVLATRPRGTSRRSWQRLAQHAARMRILRRFDEGYGQPAHMEMPYTLFLAWLGGFFTGEGSLMLERHGARLAIHLRRDDRPLLEAIRAQLGIGAIYDAPAYGTAAPSSSWVVFARAELRAAAGVLARAGLRGRKARHFQVWETALDAFDDPDRFEACRAALRAARRYVPPTQVPYTSCAISRAQEAYVEVLHQYAAETSGPLTCTGFTKVRRRYPHWPNRVTIVRAFGSWAAALDAAGLRHRAHARSAA